VWRSQVLVTLSGTSDDVSVSMKNRTPKREGLVGELDIMRDISNFLHCWIDFCDIVVDLKKAILINYSLLIRIFPYLYCKKACSKPNWNGGGPHRMRWRERNNERSAGLPL
jgi:hypothetical protein